MTADDGARKREPLLLGLIGGVIGIVLAVVVFGGFLGSPAGATASPTTAAVATDGASTAPSPSLPPTDSPAPSVAVTVPPATAAPTGTPATPTSQPTPTPNTNPRIVSFDTPNQEDCTNATAGSVHLEWSIRNATGVTISIDGPGIYDSYAGLTGSVDLPYGCDFTVLKHTYTLTTVGGTGPAASVTKTIRTRAPSITSFVMGSPDCSGGGSVGISMSYVIRAATGAELHVGDTLYASYSGKETDDIVQFNCDAPTPQMWTLTTTGGYGPEASKTVSVADK